MTPDSHNGSPFWLKVIKELGSLGVVVFMAYYTLVNLNQAIRDNTATLSKLSENIATLNVMLQSQQKGQRSSVPVTIP